MSCGIINQADRKWPAWLQLVISTSTACSSNWDVFFSILMIVTSYCHIISILCNTFCTCQFIRGGNRINMREPLITCTQDHCFVLVFAVQRQTIWYAGGVGLKFQGIFFSWFLGPEFFSWKKSPPPFPRISNGPPLNAIAILLLDPLKDNLDTYIVNVFALFPLKMINMTRSLCMFNGWTNAERACMFFLSALTSFP